MATKLLIWLDNGQNVQTITVTSADLAGLVNAGTDKTFTVVDKISGLTIFIVTAHVVSFQDVPDVTQF